MVVPFETAIPYVSNKRDTEKLRQGKDIDESDRNDIDDLDVKPIVPIVPFNSMFLFEPNNVLRRGIHFLLNLKYFDAFIMLVISGSSVALATEDPIDENSNRNRILNYLDYGFTVVFTAEMLLKVIILLKVEVDMGQTSLNVEKEFLC